MPERRNIASSQDNQANHGNRGAELAAKADLMLARYPADLRDQVTELLRVLAEKPKKAEQGVC
jgi:hypothetical protein